MNHYYEAKKIKNGYVMVRDYNVQNAFNAKADLVIKYKNYEMVIPNKDLRNYKQFNKTRFQSYFNKDQFYEVYNFKWKPNKYEKKENENQQKLF